MPASSWNYSEFKNEAGELYSKLQTIFLLFVLLTNFKIYYNDVAKVVDGGFKSCRVCTLFA